MVGSFLKRVNLCLKNLKAQAASRKIRDRRRKGMYVEVFSEWGSSIIEKVSFPNPNNSTTGNAVFLKAYLTLFKITAGEVIELNPTIL